jgi:magnesium-transporting ATPase (P-type)
MAIDEGRRNSQKIRTVESLGSATIICTDKKQERLQKIK